MQTFTFSIRQNLRESWNIVTNHIWFFIGIQAIGILISLLGQGIALTIITTVASFGWGIVYKKYSLAAARNQEEALEFSTIKQHLPSFMDMLKVLGIIILSGLLTLAGFILLIIPGIYVGIRISFAIMAYIDRKEGVRASIRYSWNITKGKIWTIALTGIVGVGVYLLGFIALIIGLVVAAPIVSVLMTRLYVALSTAYNAKDAVVPQPAEIPADLPETPAQQ